jgi:phospholipid-binding lipoprotein MlaA
MRTARAALGAAALLLAGCAHAPADDPPDPLETVNRGIFRFNEKADQYVLRPVAQGYAKVMPGFARTGVRNFFANMALPTVMVNDLLQLKFLPMAQDFSRLVLNSTFGVAGLIDVATPAGLPANDEDFGQTLGRWGVGEGWYLMLPFFGPSNNRDLLGRGVDGFTSPLFYAEPDELVYGLGVLNQVDNRADLLRGDRFLEGQLDRYVFIRTIYLQSRQGKVYDGSPPKEDYDFDEEGEEAGEEEGKDEAEIPEG